VATEDSAARQAAGQRAATELREALAVVAEVEILPRDTIPRAGYKATRVVEPG
jgi:hypothetical protein